jgi:hypothetical protein
LRYSAIDLFLAGVAKSQVFSMRLDRRKFEKNCSDWIRRKFSIDEGCGQTKSASNTQPFRNHIAADAETSCSPSALNAARASRDSSRNTRRLTRARSALAFA